MYDLIPLNRNNIYKFKELNSMRHKFNKLNKDFFCIYNQKNFFQKIFERKRISLLKKDSKYIGYIWIEPINNDVCKIEALNIINPIKEIEGCKILLNSIKSYCTFYYDCENNEFNCKVLSDLGFKKSKEIYEIYLSLNKYNIVYNPSPKITFEKLILGKHEKLRCILQNKIFYSKDRIPLDVADIYYDEAQEYYFNDGAVFIKKNKEYIGYGQIIIKDNTPYIVNFGIAKQWQQKGYGALLLHHLIQILKNYDYTIVKINVDYNNFSAINLYKSFGFLYEKGFSTWILKNKGA